MAGAGPLFEGSVRLTIAQLARHDMRPTRSAQRLMVPSGDRSPFHFERLLPLSRRSLTQQDCGADDGNWTFGSLRLMVESSGAEASGGRLASVNNSRSTAMSSSLRVILVCTALVSWLPAQAQFLGPGLNTDEACPR